MPHSLEDYVFAIEQALVKAGYPKFDPQHLAVVLEYMGKSGVKQALDQGQISIPDLVKQAITARQQAETQGQPPEAPQPDAKESA